MLSRTTKSAPVSPVLLSRSLSGGLSSSSSDSDSHLQEKSIQPSLQSKMSGPGLVEPGMKPQLIEKTTYTDNNIIGNNDILENIIITDIIKNNDIIDVIGDTIIIDSPILIPLKCPTPDFDALNEYLSGQQNLKQANLANSTNKSKQINLAGININVEDFYRILIHINDLQLIQKLIDKYVSEALKPIQQASQLHTSKFFKIVKELNKLVENNALSENIIQCFVDSCVEQFVKKSKKFQDYFLEFINLLADMKSNIHNQILERTFKGLLVYNVLNENSIKNPIEFYFEKKFKNDPIKCCKFLIFQFLTKTENKKILSAVFLSLQEQVLKIEPDKYMAFMEDIEKKCENNRNKSEQDTLDSLKLIFDRQRLLKENILNSKPEHNKKTKSNRFDSLMQDIKIIRQSESKFGITSSNSLTGISALGSSEVLNNLIDTFFSSGSEKGELPIVMQKILESVTLGEKDSYISDIYYLIDLIEKTCETNLGKVYCKTPCATILDGIKTLLQKFYTKDDSGAIKLIDAVQIKKNIEIEMNAVNVMHNINKGKENTAGLYNLKGYSMIFIYNLFTDLGAFTDKINFAGYHSEIAYNSMCFALAGPLFALWQQEAAGPSVEIAINIQLGLKTIEKLKAMLPNEPKIKDSEKRNYSKHVLNKMKKNEIKNKSFPSIRTWWLKQTYWLTASCLEYQNGRLDSKNVKLLAFEKDNFLENGTLDFIDEVDGRVFFKNLIEKMNKSSFDYSKIFKELEDLKKVFKFKYNEEDNEEFKKFINTKVFKHNKFRGTLLQHIMHKFSEKYPTKNKDYYNEVNQVFLNWELPISNNNNQENDLSELNKHVSSHLADLTKYSESSSYVDIHNYFHDVIHNSPKDFWADRKKASLAIHRLVLIALKNTHLKKEEAQYLVQWVNQAILLQDKGLAVDMRRRRSFWGRNTVIATVGYQFFTTKRYDMAVEHTETATDSSGHYLIPIGWMGTSLAAPLLEYNNTLATTQYKSMESFVSLVKLYVNNKKFKTDKVNNDDETLIIDYIHAFSEEVYNNSSLKLEKRISIKEGTEKSLREIIEILYDKNLLISVLENYHDREEPLLFVLQRNLGVEEATEVFKRYNDKQKVDRIANLEGDEFNDSERFKVFLNSEIDKVTTADKAQILIFKAMSYLFDKDLNDDSRKKCLKVLMSTVHNAYEDRNSPFRILTKRSKKSILAFKSTHRAAFAGMWGAAQSYLATKSGVALFTTFIALSGPWGIAVACFVLFGVCSARVVAYATADLWEHTENQKAFVTAKADLNKYLKKEIADSYQGNDKKLGNYKTSKKVMMKFNKKISRNVKLNIVKNLRDFNEELKKMTTELCHDNGIDHKKIEIINELVDIDSKKKKLDFYIQKIMLQGFSNKTEVRICEARVIRIISECELPHLEKICLLISLFKAVHEGSGSHAILKRENSYMRSKRFFLPTAVCGGLGANGSISTVLFWADSIRETLTSGTIDLLNVLVMAVGDTFITTSLNGRFSKKANEGHTDSWQSVLRLIKLNLIFLGREYKKQLDAQIKSGVKPLYIENWDSIDKLICSVLDTHIGRSGTRHGKTNSSQLNKTLSCYAEENKAKSRSGAVVPFLVNPISSTTSSTPSPISSTLSPISSTLSPVSSLSNSLLQVPSISTSSPISVSLSPSFQQITRVVVANFNQAEDTGKLKSQSSQSRSLLSIKRGDSTNNQFMAPPPQYSTSLLDSLRVKNTNMP